MPPSHNIDSPHSVWCSPRPATGWHHLSTKPEATLGWWLLCRSYLSYEADPFMSPISEVPQRHQPPDTPASHSETFVSPTSEVPQRYLPPDTPARPSETSLIPSLTAGSHYCLSSHSDHTYHASLTCVLAHTFSPNRLHHLCTTLFDIQSLTQWGL